METAGEEIDEFRLDHSHFSVARLIEERLRALECLPIPTKQPKAVDDASPLTSPVVGFARADKA